MFVYITASQNTRTKIIMNQHKFNQSVASQRQWQLCQNNVATQREKKRREHFFYKQAVLQQHAKFDPKKQKQNQPQTNSSIQQITKAVLSVGVVLWEKHSFTEPLLYFLKKCQGNAKCVCCWFCFCFCYYVLIKQHNSSKIK